MVTDGLCPVITKNGVGTICTLNDQEVLTEGLEFHKMKISRDFSDEEGQWLVRFINNDLDDLENNIHSLTRNSAKLYVTADTLFKTPNGWRLTKNLKQRELIKAYFIRCLVCQKLYMPRRPMVSACCLSCSIAAKKAGLSIFKPINEESVKTHLEEKWAHIIYVSFNLGVRPGTEIIRVDSIENAKSLYCGGVLLSTESMQSGYNKSTE